MRQILAWNRLVPGSPFFGFVFSCLLISINAPLFAESDARLQTVIAALRENEALYDNLEVHWHESYRKKYYPEVEKADVPQSAEMEGRWVCQQGMFYLNYEGQRTGPSADPRQTGVHVKKGYDGKQTRILELQNGYVRKKIQGPAYDYRAFQPHLIPLRWARYVVPLATILEGRDAILSHPRGRQGNLSQNLFPTASYVGEEKLNGLRCIKISLAHVRNKGTSARRDFWLAIDRNYLPIKTESYNYFYSKEIPIETAELADLQEIEPGIWFPFTSSITVLDGIKLREDNSPVVSWKREYKVSQVSLKPEYAVDFFRKITLPDGTPIEEGN